MSKVDAVALNLEYDPLPLAKDNCLLPSNLVDNTNSFFTVDKVLTALPAVLAVGHGGLLPEDLWDDLMDTLVDTDKEKSITGGKEQHGIVAAYKTLRSNGYQSYLWTDKVKLRVKYEELSQNFCAESMVYFCPNMAIRTATCCRGTDNYIYQQEYFDTILNRALKQRREIGPDSFDQITATYTPVTPSPREIPPEHNSDDDSTDAGLADKQGLKVAAVEKEVISWNSPFYQTLLGLMSSVTKSAIINKTVTTFLPLPGLHRKLFKACFARAPRTSWKYRASVGSMTRQ